MYKTAAMPAEQSRASTGKKVLVPLSRYEQALFRRDMSQQLGYLSLATWQEPRGCRHTETHSSECDECVGQVGGGMRCRLRRRGYPKVVRA